MSFILYLLQHWNDEYVANLHFSYKICIFKLQWRRFEKKTTAQSETQTEQIIA